MTITTKDSKDEIIDRHGNLVYFEIVKGKVYCKTSIYGKLYEIADLAVSHKVVIESYR